MVQLLCRAVAADKGGRGTVPQCCSRVLFAGSLLEEQHPPCHPAGWCQPARPPTSGRCSRQQVSRMSNACQLQCTLKSLVSAAEHSAARAHLELAHYQPAGQHWGCAAWCSDCCTPGNDVAVCEHHFYCLCSFLIARLRVRETLVLAGLVGKAYVREYKL
jgi:hypothetical protein